MNAARLTSYLFGLFSVVMSVAAAPVYAQEANSIDGEVQANSPCDLFPEEGDYLCIQTIIPVRAELVARSGKRSYVLTSDSDGHLKGKLPKGRYTLKVRKAYYGVRTFDGAELAVSPSTLRIRGGVTSSTALAIKHKSRMVATDGAKRSR